MLDHSNCSHIKATPPFIGYNNYSYSKEDIENAFTIINKVRLFKIGFGYNDKHNKDHQEKLINEVALKEYEEMRENILSNNLLEPILITSYYNTIKENNNLYIVDENNYRHKLPLDTIGSKSIADFFDDKDIISIVFSSLGNKYNEYIKELYNNDEYKKYYFYHILGTYLVESFQDILQRNVYKKLYPASDNSENFKGVRYSFGYDALKDLSGNRIIYNLLNIEKHSIKLTDTFMFEPELSTAGIVSFCKYSHYFSN